MQRVQNKYGEDKVAVVLVSVDLGYEKNAHDAIRKNQDLLTRLDLSWPNIMARKGWDQVVRTFNRSGYGKTVIDPNGIVHTVNVSAELLDAAVAESLEQGKKAGK